ncbi:MAG: efflux RND transporter periplasmic adaptor subunit [Chloroflexi bacterium]|nr:efflux RND transporter periplasmic adaptor subunit [Chloroflexota bacterium]
MRRRLWIPLLIGGVLIVGLFIARSGSEPELASERTAVIATGPLQVWVTGTGKVQPAAQAELSFKSAGTLGELAAEVGQEVKAGQILAALDPGSLDASLLGAEADLIAAQRALQDILDGPTEQQFAQAEMGLAQARDDLRIAEYRWNNQQEGRRASSDTIRGAEARLTLAQIEVDQASAEYNALSGLPSDNAAKSLALTKLVGARADRDSALSNVNWYTGRPTEIQQALLDSELAVAQADLLQTEQDLADLKAGPKPEDVSSARASLRAAQAVVDQAQLISPIDGTVMSVKHGIGDSIVPGEVEIVVADLTVLHIVTNVDELDVADTAMGQLVEITLDALPNLVLEGSVAGIDLAPKVGTTNTQYPVRVELEAQDILARVGMTAALSILVADKQEAVLVPNWALGFDPEKGEIFVFVVDGENRERRTLVLGLRNDTYSEVLSGLEPGEILSASIEDRPRGNGGFFFGG